MRLCIDGIILTVEERHLAGPTPFDSPYWSPIPKQDAVSIPPFSRTINSCTSHEPTTPKGDEREAESEFNVTFRHTLLDGESPNVVLFSAQPRGRVRLGAL